MAYRHTAETVNHLLFKCSYARQVWAVSLVPAPTGGEWSESMYTNIYKALNPHKEHPRQNEIRRLVPWILWRIWKSRNELIYKNKDYNTLEIVNKAKEDAEEWANRKEREDQRSMNASTTQGTGKWKPPPQGWLKCNSDGSWPKEGDNCGIGWVLRDNNGLVKWMGMRALPKHRSVIETELEALRWTIMSMSRFEYNKIIFESDSLELVTMINNGEARPNLVPALRDIHLLIQYFQEVKVVHTRRGGNKTVDRQGNLFLY